MATATVTPWNEYWITFAQIMIACGSVLVMVILLIAICDWFMDR